ncbi:cyanophycinase [Nibrella saemangeumensis]|uniref:Cyanophycinase n=1 Tax=Nibrella saemangeumensis TaxID=1084526 RepID=A0ABP8NSF9_9BACT
MTAPKGKLIPIGGSEARETSEEATNSEIRQRDFFGSGILKTFLNEIDKSNPRIEVIPAASEVPEEMGKQYEKAFSDLGVKKIHIMYIKDSADADNPENLERLEKADAVLFTGGDQTNLIDKLLDTEFIKKLQDEYVNRDLVIAGTSAGAAAMSRLVIREGKSAESLIKGMVETEKGLSLLPGVIVDTHFMERGRLPRLTEALLRNPGLIGVGLCIDTGVVITEGNKMRAIGSGGAFVVLTDESTYTNYHKVPEMESVYLDNLKVHILANGAGFLLNERQFVPSEPVSEVK